MSPSIKKKINNWVCFIILLILTLFMLFPIFWLLTTSLKNLVDALSMPPKWFFSPTFENYKNVLINADFTEGVYHSIIIGVVSLLISFLVGIPAAYSLARFNFKGKKDIAFWILSTRMLPPILVLIPFYIFFRTIGLTDNIWTLIIMHVTINLALVIWMLRGFFLDIPSELEEAALIDGCNVYSAFLKITLPLSSNGIIATAALCFLFSWNELMFAIVLGGSNSNTAPAMVYRFISYNEIKWGSLSASAILILIPVLIFIGFVQKYIVRGLTFGALKQ